MTMANLAFFHGFGTVHNKIKEFAFEKQQLLEIVEKVQTNYMS